MARFTLPRDLYHGKGALEALKTFKGKKAMICVGGGSMKRFGFLARAEQYLKEAGMEVQLFEGIEPDPSVETVMKGAAAICEVFAQIKHDGRVGRRHVLHCVIRGEEQSLLVRCENISLFYITLRVGGFVLYARA